MTEISSKGRREEKERTEELTDKQTDGTRMAKEEAEETHSGGKCGFSLVIFRDREPSHTPRRMTSDL